MVLSVSIIAQSLSLSVGTKQSVSNGERKKTIGPNLFGAVIVVVKTLGLVEQLREVNERLRGGPGRVVVHVHRAHRPERRSR